MANPARGEVEWKVGEKIYTLRLGIGALLAIEADMDRLFPEQRHAAVRVVLDFINAGPTGSVSERVLQVLLLRALGEFHPEITEKAVQALREEAKLTSCCKAVKEAAMASTLEIRSAGEGPPPEDPTGPRGD